MQLENGFTDHQLARCLSRKRLELTIFPTEKCNFRCTYCYEDFLIGKMNNAVQTGVKNLIAQRAPELEELSISWFGGEPLLALSVVRNIAKHAMALSKTHGFRFSGGFTTNAYILDRALLEELVELNQNFYQITLDGWGEWHDRTRRRADGAGTFTRIWQNLLDIRESKAEFDIVLRIHLTHENFDSLKELCSAIGRKFGNDSRFRLNFQDVRKLGGSGNDSVELIPTASFASQVAVLQDVVREASGGLTKSSVKPQFLDAAELPASKQSESAGGRRAEDVASGEPYICYAAKPNHWLIRANGRVGKCTVALDDARNDLGSLSVEGKITIDQAKAQKWYGGFETLDLEQMGCPIMFIEFPAPNATKGEIPVLVLDTVES